MIFYGKRKCRVNVVTVCACGMCGVCVFAVGIYFFVIFKVVGGGDIWDQDFRGNIIHFYLQNSYSFLFFLFVLSISFRFSRLNTI